MAAANEELLRSFKEMALDQLIAKLSNRQPVESGYTQRDIALGWLVSHHHFNLSAALLGLQPPQQPRLLTFGRGEEIALIPGLSEGQYEAINQYVRREQWPYTSEGLYLKLQGSEFQHEPSLIDAFCLTPEFVAVETLFSRADLPVSKKELIAMLKEGDWKMLHTFSEQQQMSQDLSPSRRQRFLLDYIVHQSSTAANLLLQQDGAFAAKQLDDPMVVTLLKALTTKTPEAEKYALEMLSSSRSDAVWQQASLRLFDFAGMAPPVKQSRSEALSTFLPKTITPKKAAVAIAKTEPAKITPIKVPPAKKATSHAAAPKKTELVYVVQDGDSLWKISRKFKVEVNQIKKHNGLKSDTLKIGTSLRIPA